MRPKEPLGNSGQQEHQFAAEPASTGEVHLRAGTGSYAPGPSTSHTPMGRRRYGPALWMGFVGLVLAVIGAIVYFTLPSQRGYSTPSYSAITVTTSVPDNSIYFVVAQSTRSTETVTITLVATGQATGIKVKVFLSLRHGATFQDCNADCNDSSFYANETQTVAYDGLDASAYFTIDSSNLAWNSNGTNATAVLPSLEYKGSGTPFFYVYYPIAGASNYDWNSLSAGFTNQHQVAWGETAIGGYLPDEVATAVDYRTQQKAANQLFLAGVLVGAAAAAIVGAIQEALKARYEK